MYKCEKAPILQVILPDFCLEVGNITVNVVFQYSGKPKATMSPELSLLLLCRKASCLEDQPQIQTKVKFSARLKMTFKFEKNNLDANPKSFLLLFFLPGRNNSYNPAISLSIYLYLYLYIYIFLIVLCFLGESPQDNFILAVLSLRSFFIHKSPFLTVRHIHLSERTKWRPWESRWTLWSTHYKKKYKSPISLGSVTLKALPQQSCVEKSRSDSGNHQNLRSSKRECPRIPSVLCGSVVGA